MLRVWAAVAAASTVIGWFSLPASWAAMKMTLAGWWHFIEQHAAHPGLFAFGVASLLVIFVLLPVYRYVRHRPVREQFERDFSDPRNEDAREALVRLLNKAYRFFKNKSDQSSEIPLHELINKSSPPPYSATFNGNILSWSTSLPNKFHDDSMERRLWDFCYWIYSDKQPCGLEQREYEKLLWSRRVASKFWDRWAKELYAGRLLSRDIRRQIAANDLQIRVLAYLEAAHALAMSMDRGRGKTWLFKFANGEQPLPWYKRWRNKM